MAVNRNRKFGLGSLGQSPWAVSLESQHPTWPDVSLPNTFGGATRDGAKSHGSLFVSHSSISVSSGSDKPTDTRPSPRKELRALQNLRVSHSQAVVFGSSCITIVVGEGNNQRKFSIHGALLCVRSEFFKKATTGGWKEAEDGVVKLGSEDPDTFALYEQLVYTGRLPSKQKSKLAEYTVLAKLYTLGEMLQDTGAKNSALEAILTCSKEKQPDGSSGYCPSSQIINIIYDGTPGPCLARSLMVDFYTFQGDKS